MMQNTTIIFDTTENVSLPTTTPDGVRPMPPTPSLTDLLKPYAEFVWADNLGRYVFPVIIGLGTIGNILSFLVMVRRAMIITPTCFYMAILAISDTVILYVDCLRKWSFIVYGENSWNLNTAACRSFYFLSYSSFHYSVWIIVAMTMERFFAIRYPLKFLTVGSVKKTKIACLIILIFVLLLNCQFMWSIKLDEKGRCVPEAAYNDFHKDMVPWIDAVFYSFLPFTILITFNVLIICSFRSNIPNSSTTHPRSSIHPRMTAMLLSVTFTFIFMTAPKAILFCIRNEVFGFLKNNTIDLQEVALYTLITRIADLCIYTNHAINILLYCVTGQRFRKEMKNMFTCHRTRRKTFSSNKLQSSRYQTTQIASSNIVSYDNDTGIESYQTLRTVSSNLATNSNGTCQDYSDHNQYENSL